MGCVREAVYGQDWLECPVGLRGREGGRFSALAVGSTGAGAVKKTRALSSEGSRRRNEVLMGSRIREGFGFNVLSGWLNVVTGTGRGCS